MPFSIYYRIIPQTKLLTLPGQPSTKNSATINLGYRRSMLLLPPSINIFVLVLFDCFSAIIINPLMCRQIFMRGYIKTTDRHPCKTNYKLEDPDGHCVHSWKCYVNPEVEIHYHRIMMLKRVYPNRFPCVTRQTRKSFPLTNAIRQSRRDNESKQSNYNIDSQLTTVSSTPSFHYPSTRYTNSGTSKQIQTDDVVVSDPEGYNLMQQQRKYLRDKFMEHYEIQHKRKL